MKTKILLIALIGMNFTINAQEKIQTGIGLKNDFIYKNGNIGIGTTNPSAQLHLKKSLNTANYPSQTSRGDIFQLYTNINNSFEIGLAGASNTRRSWILSRHSDISGSFGKYYSTLHLQPDTGDKSQYRGIAIGYNTNQHIDVGTHLAVNGNVGIGTINPGLWKLAVNGNIKTKEIKVTLDGWSDFVFEKEYNLASLKEVESHIREKGHLKDIPSAKEVEKNGIYLGEMNSKLLQKIEELTLYTIQQEKRLNSIDLKNEKLEKENESLKYLATKFIELQKRMEKLEKK